MACGLNHTVCVSSDGNLVWAFGDGDYGKLGLGNATAKSTPTKVELLCNVGVKKVAGGTQFTVALTRDGRVYTWGQGRSGGWGRGVQVVGTHMPWLWIPLFIATDCSIEKSSSNSSTCSLFSDLDRKHAKRVQ